MSGDFFSIVDYVQSSDARQGKPSPHEESDLVTPEKQLSPPQLTRVETYSYYQQPLTESLTSHHQQVGEHQRLPLSTFGGTERATQSTVNWDAPISSTSKLTTQRDFIRMGQPKQRATLTDQQRSVLLEFYDRCQYIKTDDVIKIVDKTGLTIRQVRNWFNNRRAAAKRSSSSSSPSVSNSSK